MARGQRALLRDIADNDLLGCGHRFQDHGARHVGVLRDGMAFAVQTAGQRGLPVKLFKIDKAALRLGQTQSIVQHVAEYIIHDHAASQGACSFKKEPQLL